MSPFNRLFGCCLCGSSSSSSSSSSLGSSSPGSSSSSIERGCYCGVLEDGTVYKKFEVSGFPASYEDDYMSSYAFRCEDSWTNADRSVFEGFDSFNGTYLIRMDDDGNCDTPPFFRSDRTIEYFAETVRQTAYLGASKMCDLYFDTYLYFAQSKQNVSLPSWKDGKLSPAWFFHSFYQVQNVSGVGGWLPSCDPEPSRWPSLSDSKTLDVKGFLGTVLFTIDVDSSYVLL